MRRAFRCLLVIALLAPALLWPASAYATLTDGGGLFSVTIEGDQDAAGVFTSPVTISIAPTSPDTEYAEIRWASSLWWPEYGPWVYDEPILTNVDGPWTFMYWAIDAEGYLLEYREVSFELRKEPAVASIALEGARRADGSFYTPVTIGIAVEASPYAGVTSASYAIDGVHQGRYGEPVTWYGEGLHTVVAWPEAELLGVGAPAEVTFEIRYDDPVTTASLVGEGLGSGIYRDSVELVLDATTTSGVPVDTFFRPAGQPWYELYAGPMFFGPGTYDIEYWSRDALGNEEERRVVSFSVVEAMPVTRATVEGTAGDNGWYTSAVAVTLAPDAASAPLDRIEYSLDGLAWSRFATPVVIDAEGRSALYYRGVGESGVVENAQRLDLAIDTVAPTFTDGGNRGPWLLNGPSQPIAWTACDAGSGIAETSSFPALGTAIPTDRVGVFPIACTARDVAGNTASATAYYHVVYDFALAEPVNADGSSVFNAGRTVPIRFTLTDASGVGVPDAVARFSVVRVSDAVTGTDLEAVPAADPSAGYVFETTPGGRYSYNWSTKGLEPGTYRLLIVLDDATTRSVFVSLR